MVERARLESVYTSKGYRGFESLSADFGFNRVNTTASVIFIKALGAYALFLNAYWMALILNFCVIYMNICCLVFCSEALLLSILKPMQWCDTRGIVIVKLNIRWKKLVQILQSR